MNYGQPGVDIRQSIGQKWHWLPLSKGKIWEFYEMRRRRYLMYNELRWKLNRYELKPTVKVQLDLSFADAHNYGPNGFCFLFIS